MYNFLFFDLRSDPEWCEMLDSDPDYIFQGIHNIDPDNNHSE
jgi:hypothetical protein